MALFSKKRSDLPRRRRQVSEDPTSTIPEVFMRNRTLTGTTSPQLNSVGSDTHLESTRTHTHRLTIVRRKVFSVFLTTLLVVAFIWTLISHMTASAAISTSETNIVTSIDKHRYEKVIQEYLDINPIGRLSFFLDQSALTAYVANKLPEVQNVSQRGMAGFGITEFSLTFRKPLAGWKIGPKQYYVDADGIPFDINYYMAPDVQIVDNSGVTVKAGTTAIASKRFLGYVGRVVSQAANRGYTVTKAVLPPDTTRELEVTLKQGGYVVKLSIDRPVGEQIEDMDNAVRYFTAHNQVPRYIDVRVGGKAFYKF